MAEIKGIDGTGFVFKQGEAYFLYKLTLDRKHMIYEWNDMVGWTEHTETFESSLDDLRQWKIKSYIDSPYHIMVGILEQDEKVVPEKETNLQSQRIKICELIPTFNQKVGDVIELIDGVFKFERHDERPVGLEMDSIKRYPHLFRLLDWYEYRDLSILPKYLNIEGKIFMIDHWENDLGTRPVSKDTETEEAAGEFLSVNWHFMKSKSLPATIYDYGEYKARKMREYAIKTGKVVITANQSNPGHTS